MGAQRALRQVNSVGRRGEETGTECDSPVALLFSDDPECVELLLGAAVGSTAVID